MEPWATWAVRMSWGSHAGRKAKLLGETNALMVPAEPRHWAVPAQAPDLWVKQPLFTKSVHRLGEWSPTFLAQGLGSGGSSLGIIQAPYTDGALYFYYCYVVIYNEIITQLTIMQNQWEPWACFPETRWSHLRVVGDSDTQSVLHKSSLRHDLVWLLSPQKTLLHKYGMPETEAGFSVFCGNPEILCFDFNPECMDIWSLQHTFKATVISHLKW